MNYKKPSWIFISHSSKDINKIRMIRNEFEKYEQNPLAFHLKCLNTDTFESEKELEDLIKREIESRDWFVYCESSAAANSKYVKMEREFVASLKDKTIWYIDLNKSEKEIKEKVKEICTDLQIFISYNLKDREIYEGLAKEFNKNDFSVWSYSNLTLGGSWDEQIESAIESVAKKGFFLYILTDNSINSSFAKDELLKANKEGATIYIINYSTSLHIDKFFGDYQMFNFKLPTKEEHFIKVVNRIKEHLKHKLRK